MLGIISTLLLLSTVIYVYGIKKRYKNDSTDYKKQLLLLEEENDDLKKRNALLNEDIVKFKEKINNINQMAVTSLVSNNDFLTKGDTLDDVIGKTLSRFEGVLSHAKKTVALENEGIKNLEVLITKNLETANAINEVSSDIKELKNFASKINTITEKIDAVAEQTNLLALNASIEAARAGEAGKGFAVVATEIRALAEDVSNATKEIEGLIKTIVLKTETTANSMERTEASLDGQNLAVSETYQSFSQALDENRIIVDRLEGFDQSIVEMNNDIEQNKKVISDLENIIEKYKNSIDNKNNEIELFNQKFSELNEIVLEFKDSSS